MVGVVFRQVNLAKSCRSNETRHAPNVSHDCPKRRAILNALPLKVNRVFDDAQLAVKAVLASIKHGALA
jgi:hypothetical protein